MAELEDDIDMAISQQLNIANSVQEFAFSNSISISNVFTSKGSKLILEKILLLSLQYLQVQLVCMYHMSLLFSYVMLCIIRKYLSCTLACHL